MVSPTSNKKVITRLSSYRRALLRMQKLGYSRLISTNLGHEVGVAPSQVRKDFSIFGVSGNKKGGYNIDNVLLKLETILGKNKIHEVVVVGAGNIGQALINFREFEHEGIRIIASFDIDPSKWNERADVPVFPMEKLPAFISGHVVKAAIIAVPDISAQQVCDLLTAAGVEGVLSFAPIRLKVADNVVVNYVNIFTKLENLLYFVDGFGKTSY